MLQRWHQGKGSRETGDSRCMLWSFWSFLNESVIRNINRDDKFWMNDALWEETETTCRMKCPFAVILVSIASEIMEVCRISVARKSLMFTKKRKGHCLGTVFSTAIPNLYSISGVFSWEVYMVCFPWFVTGASWKSTAAIRHNARALWVLILHEEKKWKTW